MNRNIAILILFIQLSMTFGHGIISIGHSLLHLTASVSHVHDHGELHDALDHQLTKIIIKDKTSSYDQAALCNLLMLFPYSTPILDFMAIPSYHKAEQVPARHQLPHDVYLNTLVPPPRQLV